MKRLLEMLTTDRRRLMRIALVLVIGGTLLEVAIAQHRHERREAAAQGHRDWHDCRSILWWVNDASESYAASNAVPTGTPLQWSDLEAALRRSEHRMSAPGDTSVAPLRCPRGGAYVLQAVGTRTLCSVPYHRWDNCISESDPGGAWW